MVTRDYPTDTEEVAAFRKSTKIEREVFLKALPLLLEEGHGGKYVAIHGGGYLEPCNSMGEAIRAGTLKWGDVQFYVGKITALDIPFNMLNRNLGYG